MTAPMTAPTPSRWSRRFGILGLASAALAALGAYGSGWGLWQFTLGFLMVGVALLLALVAAFGGLILLMRRRSSGAIMITGMLTATALIAIIGIQIKRGADAPPIHDISTDLANPPQFAHLTPRADLYAGLDGGIAEWRRLHSAAYGDIAPVTGQGSPDAAMRRALTHIEAEGWTVAHNDPRRIEATAVVSPFRFRDDIVVLATPGADGGAWRIDVRSVSRVGMSDLGVNARRVRALLADIRGAED